VEGIAAEWGQGLHVVETEDGRVHVVIWAPSFLVIGDLDTWQLIINTATTIVTFLLVALLQNTQARSERAVQDKLNAIADGLADLMAAQQDHFPGLSQDLKDLRQAVGLENRETS